MKLSVIIPNLHSPVVDQTLAALGAQTWPMDQAGVVIVGLDRHGHVARFPFARHIDTHQPTPPGPARNIGIRATDGPLVVFLDADCVPRPDWLARLARWFVDPGVSVVGGGIVFDWHAPYWNVCENLSSFHDYLARGPTGQRIHLPACNLAIRRAALEAVGLFDDGWTVAAEDFELTTRLRLAGHTLHFDPEAVVEHRQPPVTGRGLRRKAWSMGYHSLKVHPHYADMLGFPHLLRHPAILRAASPLLAAAITARIRAQQPSPRWSVWPGVFLLKLAWCWGAARRLADDRAVVRPAPRSGLGRDPGERPGSRARNQGA